MMKPLLQILAIKFVTFVVKFVTLAIESVTLATQSVALAIEFVALAIEFVTLLWYENLSVTRLAAAANMKTRCSSCNKTLFRYLQLFFAIIDGHGLPQTS